MWSNEICLLGEVLPTEKRFDSNCITPGTVFMARLHDQLKYFIKEKISTDPLWSNVKVILSGHEVRKNNSKIYLFNSTLWLLHW